MNIDCQKYLEFGIFRDKYLLGKRKIHSTTIISRKGSIKFKIYHDMWLKDKIIEKCVKNLDNEVIINRRCISLLFCFFNKNYLSKFKIIIEYLFIIFFKVTAEFFYKKRNIIILDNNKKSKDSYYRFLEGTFKKISENSCNIKQIFFFKQVYKRSLNKLAINLFFKVVNVGKLSKLCQYIFIIYLGFISKMCKSLIIFILLIYFNMLIVVYALVNYKFIIKVKIRKILHFKIMNKLNKINLKYILTKLSIFIGYKINYLSLNLIKGVYSYNKLILKSKIILISVYQKLFDKLFQEIGFITKKKSL